MKYVGGAFSMVEITEKLCYIKKNKLDELLEWEQTLTFQFLRTL